MQLGMLRVTDEGSVERVVGFIAIFRKNSEVHNQFGRKS
jgi:hypothetical protein